MRRPSTLTYLTIGLVAMTVTLLSLAHLLGLIPDQIAERARQRSQMCEVLTLSMAAAAETGNFRDAATISEAMLQRELSLLSVGLKLEEDGSYAYSTDSHSVRWGEPADETLLTHLQVPIQRNNAPWGVVEFRFEPLLPPNGWWALQSSLVQLILFMTAAGLVIYRFYLRRMLTFLDPSRAVPQRVRTAFDTLAEGVVILDEKLRVVLANKAFCDAVRTTEHKLEGRKLDRLRWLGIEGQKYPWIDAAETGEDQRGCPLKIEHKDAGLSFMVNATRIQGDHHSIRGILVTFDNVTSVEQKNLELADMINRLEESRDQIRRQNDELQLLATRDPLTGCLNRRAFRERLEAEWKRRERHGLALSCVMTDIDHFKSINDNHGHSSGDAVLQKVAETLRQSARASDIVCRFGGEEFCILLPETTLDQAEIAAEKFRAAIAAEPIIGIPVTASFGAAVCLDDFERVEDLIEMADRALYAAKRGGRNRVARGDDIPDDLSSEQAHQEPVSVTPDIPMNALNGLLSALEQRDPATAAHSRRVADLCVALGSQLLAADECFILEVAALLHDVGKIGVSDTILLKPGPLTEAERKLMDEHERFGIEIINAAFGSPELTNIVHCHHAFFGGNPRDPGLPQGVNIPLRARILSIADAYDAMVSDRPYRKAMEVEQAIKELRVCSGTQFDPWCVEQFVAMLAARGGHGRLHPLPPQVDVALQLAVSAERVAAVIESNDMRQARILTERLGALSDKTGMDRVSRQVAELEQQLAHCVGDEAVRQLKRLLDECLEVQHELLSAAGQPERFDQKTEPQESEPQASGEA